VHESALFCVVARALGDIFGDSACLVSPTERFAVPAVLCVLTAVNAHDPTRPVLLTQAARGAILPAIRQGTRRDGSVASVLSTRTYSVRDPADENLARVIDDARTRGSPPLGS